MSRVSYVIAAQYQDILPGQKWRNRNHRNDVLEIVGRISPEIVLTQSKDSKGNTKTEQMYDIRLKQEYKRI